MPVKTEQKSGGLSGGVLPCAVVFSAFPECFAWFEKESEQAFGKIALSSPLFDFSETDYYRASMGAELKLCIYVFNPLMNPDLLAQKKRASIEFEQDIKRTHAFNVQRPINIDAGYLNGAKLVLASTKDGSHRISIGQEIFAEVTLIYRYGAWTDLPWTYPNYKRLDYKNFLSQAREVAIRLGSELNAPQA